MKQKNIYFLYISFLVLCLIFCMFTVIKERVGIENNYKTYETLMELKEIKAYASVENRDYLDVARDFIDIGVNSIVVIEETIDSLKLNDKFKLSVRYDGLDLELNGTKQGLDFIKQGLEQTVKDGRNIYFKSEDTLIIEGKLSDFAYNSSQIMRDFTGKRVALENNKQSLVEYVGLGYIADDLQELKDSGFNLNLRPVYVTAVQDGKKSIDRYIKTVKKYSPSQKLVIFAGEELLGSQSNTDYLAEKLEESLLIPVAIETSEQNGNVDLIGLKDLVQKMDYHTTRLFSTLSYIQDRYDYGIAGHRQGQEIMNSYYRAISERNIRAIYFRVFRYKNGFLITDMDIYRQRFNELNSRLYKFYKIKPVSEDNDIQIMDSFSTTKRVKFIAIVAIIISWIMIFYNIFKNTYKIQLILLFLGLAASVTIYKLNIMINSFNMLIALLGTISFAVLSIIHLLKSTKKYEENKSLEKYNLYKLFILGIFELLKCIIISLIGCVFIVTLYGESVYLLEFSKFTGVKISQMLPLLIVPFAYLSIIGLGKYYDKNRSLKEQVIETMQKNVKIWQVIIVLAMLGVLGLMILRSGHTSNVDPSSSELLMRNVFEYIFPARPRNKAIFLGYPALILLIMISSKKKFRSSYILFALASTIGQADILNTFSHIRTPFMLSIQRVAVEYGVSLIITLAIVIFINIISKLIQRGKKINA